MQPARIIPIGRPPAVLRGTLGEGADGRQIRCLAALSGDPPPEGPALLAEVAGHVVAAIGIFDGRVVSDPERSTRAMRVRLWLLRLQVRPVIAAGGL